MSDVQKGRSESSATTTKRLSRYFDPFTSDLLQFDRTLEVARTGWFRSFLYALFVLRRKE
jgi:hypothetical protein